MNPIREYQGGERRRNHNRAILIAFWAVVGICAVISGASIVVADRATTTANRSESGFCIAVHLIEQGAVGDAKIAKSPTVPPEVRRVRTQQYTGSLRFALQLRQLGFHCRPPTPDVINLVNEIRRSQQ
jgi:hypothetical protein